MMAVGFSEAKSSRRSPGEGVGPCLPEGSRRASVSSLAVVRLEELMKKCFQLDSRQGKRMRKTRPFCLIIIAVG